VIDLTVKLGTPRQRGGRPRRTWVALWRRMTCSPWPVFVSEDLRFWFVCSHTLSFRAR